MANKLHLHFSEGWGADVKKFSGRDEIFGAVGRIVLVSMITNELKDRVYGTLRATGRDGIEAVIDYLESSNYFRRGCYTHHKEYGGLAQHSLEVYDHMLAHAGGLPSDSVAVVGLFHDLGKTVRRDGRGHGYRSVAILDRLGFALTDAERVAIARHHDRSPYLLLNPLRARLTRADCVSTAAWKHAHRA